MKITKKFVFGLPIVILLVAIFACIWIFSLRINVTNSMPKGIYRALHVAPQVGSLVEVCLPIQLAIFGKSRDYIHAGDCPGNAEPLLKQVVAVGGDTVLVTFGSVRVNGKSLPHSGVLLYDDQHRSLASQVASMRHVLKPDDIWLYGQCDPKSWDSRYFGAISRTSIRQVLQPLWIWHC